jgi:hypothetical protein
MSAIRRVGVLLSVAFVLLVSVGVGSAFGAAAFWRVSSESAPTNLAPGQDGQVILQVSNLGDAVAEGATSPVTIVDRLPVGVTALAVSPTVKNGVETSCAITTVVTCRFAGKINPYEQLPIPIKVKIELPPGTVTTLSQEVSVEGGGAAQVSSTSSLRIAGEPTQYGVSAFEFTPFNEDGSPATQAGSQPFQITTTLVLNQEGLRNPIELPKDLTFNLPPGLIGNATAVKQCTLTEFAALVEETNLCGAETVVGVATLVAHEPNIGVVQKTVPVFNLVPSRGEPARFGFEILGKIPVLIETGVRSGKDYGVVVSVHDASQTAGLLNSQVTLWGDPGDPRHNASRGWECVAGGLYAKQAKKGACPAASAEPEKPFLTVPTSCAASPASEPFTVSLSTDSWTHPESFVNAAYSWMTGSGALLGFEGCAQLPFNPAIAVTPVQHTASTPTGLKVNVEVPQGSTLTPGALAEADVRDTTVTLPEGVQLSPAAANGLEACSEAQVGFTGFNPALAINEFNTQPVSCPDGSKLGTVKILTPLLSHPLQGAVYLASPAPNGASEPGRNPFNSLVALYLVAEDPVSGVLVKLAGEGELDENTLRISTTFRNTPQVPFENLELELFDGPRASVTTPALCGNYSTDALFTPWSGTTPLAVSSAGDLAVTSGVGGSACPAGVPFTPGFLAQSENQQAGAFTSFNLELTRPDGDQALSALSMHLPPGVAAMLSSVTLCSEAQAGASACPPGSEIGQATAIAGLGSDPYTETGGRVFITGPYGGAPFGLEIVTPAVAGPFNLGFVTVRSKLFIDPNNASVTIVSDPLPTQLRGIPLQLKRVIVNVDRPGFQFNPTSCNPMSINGTISGSEGASAAVSSPFQVSGCAALAFSPRLTASAGGHGSKADGTSLDVKVESGGVGSGGVAQAGIAKVDLQLPLALSSRLPTLQKACVEAVFNADPASCDEGSVIGEATIHTPVLSSPLTGPAYLVSHGGAEFPDVEFVLQGEGITLVLDGKTAIKHGITYSKFESAPDAPFTVFETELPAGPHGVLAPNVPESEHFSLCKATLAMPTTITAQNGAVINQTTNITVSGCGGVLPSKTAKPTRAQLLTKALKACHKDKHRSKRTACEKQARKRYAPKKPAHKTAHKTARNATTSRQHNR